MQTVKITLLFLICLILLSACGNKGPLYLPKENPESIPTTEQDADANSDDDDNKKDTEKKKSDFS